MLYFRSVWHVWLGVVELRDAVVDCAAFEFESCVFCISDVLPLQLWLACLPWLVLRRPFTCCVFTLSVFPLPAFVAFLSPIPVLTLKFW